MLKNDKVIRTPWDQVPLGIDTYEILSLSNTLMHEIIKHPGHYSYRADPLEDKSQLHEFGFYYCDTLIEPWCQPDAFHPYAHSSAKITRDVDLIMAVSIISQCFVHGRFHRDFNVTKQQADARYIQWLEQLHDEGSLYQLEFDNHFAGFLGFSGSRILLHALNPEFQGRGIAKYLWSLICEKLFEEGHMELTCSVSASNVKVLNLYASLGFRFRNPVDIYHRIV